MDISKSINIFIFKLINMKYQEKQELAKHYQDLLKENKSISEIEKAFVDKGYKLYEIDKIRSSANQKIQEDYIDKIEKYVIEGNLEEHFHEFDLVDSDKFEELQDKAIRRIRSKFKPRIKKMSIQGFTVEDIVKKINDPFCNLEFVETQIQEYEYKEGPNKNKSLYILGAIIGIILFLFLLFGAGRLSFGLLFFIVFMFIRAYSSQEDLDRRK